MPAETSQQSGRHAGAVRAAFSGATGSEMSASEWIPAIAQKPAPARRHQKVTDSGEHSGCFLRLIWERHSMKSIMVTYPDFQSLPKGLKQLLVASESFFFEQTNLHPKEARHDEQSLAILSHLARRQGPHSPFHPLWKN